MYLPCIFEHLVKLNFFLLHAPSTLWLKPCLLVTAPFVNWRLALCLFLSCPRRNGAAHLGAAALVGARARRPLSLLPLGAAARPGRRGGAVRRAIGATHGGGALLLRFATPPKEQPIAHRWDLLRVFPGENPSVERERRLQEVLREQGALPRLVITAVASTAAVLVFVNILVVLCVLRHRQNKKQRKPSGWLNISNSPLWWWWCLQGSSQDTNNSILKILLIIFFLNQI